MKTQDSQKQINKPNCLKTRNSPLANMITSSLWNQKSDDSDCLNWNKVPRWGEASDSALDWPPSSTVSISHLIFWLLKKQPRGRVPRQKPLEYGGCGCFSSSSQGRPGILGGRGFPCVLNRPSQLAAASWLKCSPGARPFFFSYLIFGHIAAYLLAWLWHSLFLQISCVIV